MRSSIPQREMGRQKVFTYTLPESLFAAKYGSLRTKWIYFGLFNLSELLNMIFQRLAFSYKFLFWWIFSTKTMHFHAHF